MLAVGVVRSGDGFEPAIGEDDDVPEVNDAVKAQVRWAGGVGFLEAACVSLHLLLQVWEPGRGEPERATERLGGFVRGTSLMPLLVKLTGMS